MSLRTPTATIVIGVLSLLVTAGLGWLLIVGPVTGTLADVRAEATAVQRTQQTMQIELDALERRRDDLPQIREVADQLARMFPSTADQPEFFRLVTAAAARAGIGPKAITSLSPTAPVAQTTGSSATPEERAASLAAADLAVQTVTITISASYPQARDLLNNLERMDRAFLLETVSLGGAGDALVVSITGKTFVAPPLTEPDLDQRTDAASN